MKISKIEWNQLLQLQIDYDKTVSDLDKEIESLLIEIKDRTLILSERAKMFGRICDLRDEYFKKQIILYNINAEICKRTLPNFDYFTNSSDVHRLIVKK